MLSASLFSDDNIFVLLFLRGDIFIGDNFFLVMGVALKFTSVQGLEV